MSTDEASLRQSSLLPYLALAVLFLLLATQLWGRMRLQNAQFVKGTPIFTPVSLDYERKLRGGDPKSPGDVARRIEKAIDEGTAVLLAEELHQLKTWRLEMLELRDRRHALNVQLMTGSVDLAASLSTEQWTLLAGQRDHLKSKVELDIFEELLRRLEHR